MARSARDVLYFHKLHLDHAEVRMHEGVGGGAARIRAASVANVRLASSAGKHVREDSHDPAAAFHVRTYAGEEAMVRETKHRPALVLHVEADGVLIVQAAYSSGDLAVHVRLGAQGHREAERPYHVRRREPPLRVWPDQIDYECPAAERLVKQRAYVSEERFRYLLVYLESMSGYRPPLKRVR